MITVAEISECFPNNFKPFTGEFILQHARALSAHCRVIMIVPLRFLPPKELFSFNPFKTILNIFKWFSKLNRTHNFTEGNLKVIYLGYFIFPFSFMEFINVKILNILFYKRVINILINEGCNLIYCNWIRPWAKLSCNIAAELKVPFLIDHHEDIPTLKTLYPDNYKEYLKIFESAFKIIVHSNVNKIDIENENLNLNEIKINHLGQNFSVSEIPKVFTLSEINLICVSHLHEPRKNIDVLINAVFLLKDEFKLKLKIVGDGNLKNNYSGLSDSLSLSDRIEFCGAKSQKEIGELLDASDIFILPSFPEAFGVVLTEAMAKGLPVISCTGNGGAEEISGLGYPVILTKPGSVSELAGAIIKLAADLSLMNLMSEAGKETVKENFTWRQNGISTYEFIKQTLIEFKNKS